MTGEPVTISESRWKLLVFAIVRLIFGSGSTVGGIWLFLLGDPDWLVLAIIFLFPCGAILIITGLWSLHGSIWSHQIEVSRDGLRLPRWKSPIPWSQFEPFEVIYEGAKYDWIGGFRAVHRRAPPGRAFAKWAVRPGVPPPSFFSTAGEVLKTHTVKPADLAAMLEQWRTKYADKA